MKLPWFQASERVVGLNHATLSDTINRALRQMLTLCGFDPDVDFPGFTPRKSVLGAGATGSGTTDDYPSISAADAAALSAGTEFAPGTYLFNTSYTFQKGIKLHNGAKLKPAVGVTITLPPNIDAGDYQILDYTGGGNFLPPATATNRARFNIRWTGTKGDGTDDTVAFNNAINLCYGAPGNGNRNGDNNSQKNWALTVPAGGYQVDYLDLSGTVGLVMKGRGKLSTSINIKSSTSVGFRLDASAYASFEDLSIVAMAARDTAHPLVDIDNSGTYLGNYGYLLPQQYKWKNVYINCNYLAQIGLSVDRIAGGSAQGDTFNLDGLTIGQSLFASVAIGSSTVPAANAMNWTILGCDLQDHQLYGFYVNGGQVHLIGTGFEGHNTRWTTTPGASVGVPYYDGSNNQLGGRAGATHVGNYVGIDNLGCDVFVNQEGSRSTLHGVRSESATLCRGQGVSALINCEVFSGAVAQWIASSTNFVQGQIVKTANPAISLDGRAWAVWTTTPTPISTGGSEPAWASARNGYMQENVTVTSGSPTINCQCPIQVVNKGTLPGIGGNEWGCIVVDPTGVNQKFYAKILSHSQNASITLDANVPWSGNAIIHIGELVTDGSLQWIPYDFKNASGEFQQVIGGQYECGQFEFLQMLPTLFTARPSRRDFFYNAVNGILSSTAFPAFPGLFAVGVPAGSSQTELPFTKWSLWDKANQLRTYLLGARNDMFAPLLFNRMASAAPTGDVGVGGLDGSYTLAGTRTDLTRNALGVLGGVLAPDPVGYPDNVMSPPANTVGKDLVINGGTSSGTAKSGRIVFATNPGGSAGSSVNDNVESAVVDGDATAGNTRFLLYDVSKATLSRVSVGVADSGGTGFKLLRVPN